MMPREQSRLWTQLTLAALPGAVPCMRLHAKQVAWEWGLGELAEIVELLVSELATNAVKAAQETGRRSWPSGLKKDVPCVDFRLSAGEECLKPVDLPGRGCTFPDHPEQALKQGRRANAGREGTPGAYSNP
jgi:hypothetical protein